MANVIKKNIFKDLDLDFTPHPVTGDITKKTDEEAVKRSIRNLILMSRYDKPFRPDIDSRVYKLLFEPASPLVAMAIRSNIMDMLMAHEPRARLNDVQVVFDESKNSFGVMVSFMMTNSRTTSKVFVSIERLR
jgi:phage baseplate assembly protein W